MKYLLGLAAAAAVITAACAPMQPPPPDPDPEPCQPGTYSATGDEPCDPAPTGTFVDTAGATGATDCAPGTYQDETGKTSCKNADPGSFVDSGGASATTLCPLGTFQPSSGATECMLAPIGSYVDTEGATSAVPCPPGETTAAEGSASSTDCFAPAVTLAIAYSNLDSVAGYDSVTDRMISRLIDTNTDGVISAGDTLEFGEYPTDVTASFFENFQTASVTVTANIPPPGPGLAGVEAAGWYYLWNDSGFGNVEAYVEQSDPPGDPYAAPGVLLSDAATSADGPDAIDVWAVGPPSAPQADASDIQTGDTGAGFIQVDVFV